MTRNFAYVLFSAFIGSFVVFLGICMIWPQVDPVNLRLKQLGFTDIVRASSVTCGDLKGQMFVATNAIGGVVVGKVCPDNTIHVMISTTKDYPRA